MAAAHHTTARTLIHTALHVDAPIRDFGSIGRDVGAVSLPIWPRHSMLQPIQTIEQIRRSARNTHILR